MKFDKTSFEILKHFASYSKSIHIETLEKQMFFVSSEDARLAARARNIQDVTVELPLRDLPQFVSSLNMFKDVEYNISLNAGSERAIIKSESGKLKQNISLCEPQILSCPKPDKFNKYFEMDLPEFTMTVENLKHIREAIAVNSSESVTLTVENGKFAFLIANMTSKGAIEDTSNDFLLTTEIETDENFFVGLPAKNFTTILNGEYKIGVAENFVRLTAPEDAHVDYVMPTLQYSKFN